MTPFQHRAISQERSRRHGPLPEDGQVWWAQIQAIAAELGVKTNWDEWGTKRKGVPIAEQFKPEPRPPRPPFVPGNSKTDRRTAQLAREWHARQIPKTEAAE